MLYPLATRLWLFFSGFCSLSAVWDPHSCTNPQSRHSILAMAVHNLDVHLLKVSLTSKLFSLRHSCPSEKCFVGSFVRVFEKEESVIYGGLFK